MRWQHSRVDKGASTPPLSRGGSAHRTPLPVPDAVLLCPAATAEDGQGADDSLGQITVNAQHHESPACAFLDQAASPSSSANYAASSIGESASTDVSPPLRAAPPTQESSHPTTNQYNKSQHVESADLLSRTRQRCRDVRAQLASVELAIRRLLPPPAESDPTLAISSSSCDSQLDTLEHWSSELESGLRALHAAESKLRGLQLRLKSYGGLVATISIPEVENHLHNVGISPNHHHGNGSIGADSRGSGGMPRVASANSFLSLIAHASERRGGENATPTKPFPFGGRASSPVRPRSTSSAAQVIAVISRSEAGSPPRRGILKSSSAASLAHDSSPRSLTFACPSSADQERVSEPPIKHVPHLLVSAAKRPSPLVSPTVEDSPLFQSSPGLFSAAHLHHVQTSSASSSPRMSPATSTASSATSHITVAPLVLPPPQLVPRVTPPGSPRREHAPLPLPPPPQFQRAPRAGTSSSSSGGSNGNHRTRTGSLTPSEDASQLAEHAAKMDDASFLRLIRSLDMFVDSAAAVVEVAASGNEKSGSVSQPASVTSEAAARTPLEDCVAQSQEKAADAVPPCIIL